MAHSVSTIPSEHPQYQNGNRSLLTILCRILVADMTLNTINSDPIPDRNKTNSEGLGTGFNRVLETSSTTAKSSASRQRRMMVLEDPGGDDQWRCNGSEGLAQTSTQHLRWKLMLHHKFGSQV